MALRDDAASWLKSLKLQIKEGWLFSHQPSLADMALLPFVRQFAHTDATWFAAVPWPNLQAWLTLFEADALFENVMDKHAVWESKL